MEAIAASKTGNASAAWNDPPPLPETNRFAEDAVLAAGVRRYEAAWAESRLLAFGELVGRDDVLALGFRANENLPVLRSRQERGDRLDEIEFDPAWHELMRIAVHHELHRLPWIDERAGAHVARAGLMYLAVQNEFGHLCPVGMTYAGIPVLRTQPELASVWEPRLLSKEYDPAFRPADQKRGALVGMAMTERQGGSDLRTNSSRAVPMQQSGPGRPYLLTGQKWFCSAPMCDVFLVLAQARDGLSCFLLPRWLEDGRPNRFWIQRLKPKLGNLSNASSEVEFDDAVGWLVGEEGKGVRTIIEMVNLTRLDCAVTSAGMMRAAVSRAVHHCRYRTAFGERLVKQPLMRNVLADLVLEWEAATVLALRVASACDRQSASAAERLYLRLALPVAKYWICKRAMGVAGEALECTGGAGYVEDSVFPRLYRDLPLNSIWEGSGNVVCLDALRAIEKDTETLEAVAAEVDLGAGGDARLRGWAESLMDEGRRAVESEAQARRFAGRLATALQASLLLRYAPEAAADAFCGSRLGGALSGSYGALPEGAALDAILARGGATAQ